jgi:hypothetical protein
MRRAFLLVASLALVASASLLADDGSHSDGRKLPETMFCRCQEDGENFYNHRLLGDTDDRQMQERDGSGNYIVEGLTVLDCRIQKSRAADISYIRSDLHNLFATRRLLDEDDDMDGGIVDGYEWNELDDGGASGRRLYEEELEYTRTRRSLGMGKV